MRILGPLKSAYSEKCIFRGELLHVFVQKFPSKSAYEIRTFHKSAFVRPLDNAFGSALSHGKKYCSRGIRKYLYIYSKITLRTCLQFVLMEFITPDADFDTSEVHLGDADLVLSPPYDFLVLSVEEIFDLFVNDKKNHMGNCARFVLTRLPSTLKVMKDCPPSDSNWCARLGKTVAKRKGDIAVQKVAWMEMGSWGMIF